MAVGLLALVGLLAVAALHLPSVQSSLLGRALSMVEQRSGVRVAVGSMRLRPLGLRLELDGVSLAAGSAEPFLVADRLLVQVAPVPLLRGRLVVRRLAVVAPRFDGSRPLPELPAAAAPADQPAAPAWTALRLESLEIREAAAEGLPLPAALSERLQAVTLAELDVDGSLVEGRLELGWRNGRLVARPAGQPPLELTLSGELDGPADGPLRLERLTFEGEALSGRASGWLGLAATQPLSAELELRVQPALLLGVEAGGEPLRLEGRADLRAESAELELAAPGLPAELARPWLDAELFARAGLAGSRLRLAARLGYLRGELSGEADLGWRRAAEELAGVRLAARREAAAERARLEMTAELLPAAAGRRTLRGAIEVPLSGEGEPRLEEARLEGGRLDLQLPDLGEGLAALDRTWPGWLPELPAGLAAGGLRAELLAEGRLADPAVRLAGEWRPAAEARVGFRARGRPLARRLEGAVTLDGVPLGRFAEGATGSLAGDVELSLVGERLAGSLRLAGEGLGRDPLVLDRLSLAARLEDRRVGLDELFAEAAGSRLLARGEIDLRAEPGADLELELAGGPAPLKAAAGRLRLEEGRLRLEVPRAELAGEIASLAATLPLATLARLPGAEALAELPLRAAAGPLEIEWSLPPLDWAVALAVGEPQSPPPGPWRAGASGRLVVDPGLPVEAQGRVEIHGLSLTHAGHRVAAAAPLVVELGERRLRLSPAALELDGRAVELAGEGLLRAGWTLDQPFERLLEEGGISARTAAAEPLAELLLAATLRAGRVEVTLDAPLRAGDAGRLQAALPLELLSGGAGEVELDWRLPAADWAGWLAGDGEEGPALDRLVVAVEGGLRVDPKRPALAEGTLRLPRLEAEAGGQSVAASEPIALRLGGGRLTIESARLLAAGAPLALEGEIDLDPEWLPGTAPAELVRDLRLAGGGAVPAALLNPFLAGGAGEGVLQLELELRGPPAAARGELRLAGEGAGLFFASPYSVEVAAPQLVVGLEGSEVRLRGKARLNEGTLDFSGRADGERGVSLEARLEDVRAVLDYGLLALIDGDLRLTVAPGGEGLLAGRLIVDRGQLTRPLRLDSLLLEQLLPADLLGTELDPLEAIRLDLTLETRQGVRIKNNLADLKVRWEPIAVRGNPLLPILEGRLEIDPGGLVYAYGQTVRLDSAAIVYRGLADEVPVLELETTTSLEDPTIARLAGDALAAFDRPPAESAGRYAGGEAQLALTSGVAAFLGEQLTGALGETLGGARIDLRPLPIFGEADPGARLTASRELSARATLAASIDLQNAERQTYLLDLHDENALAWLSSQLFNNDLANEGATLQQRLDFGGSPVRATGPRLRRLRFEPVPGVRRRAFRRAAGYRKGERLGDGAGFEIAVSVGELLRRRGYPDARVRVVEEPVERRSGVALMVRIDSGPRVEFRFAGESLPRPLRRAVAGLYRGDFYEPTAIEEMRAEAVRAWRSLGHLAPQVTIEREVLAEGPPEQRRVTVESRPGERLELGPPTFVGLPAGEAARLAALFDTRLRRTELAAGLAAAERRALDGLRALGWPEAKITGRELSPERDRLTVTVEPGERLRVATLELLYAEGARTEVEEAGGLRAGDPARADLLARAALEVERELRDAGYLDAEITLRLEPLAGGSPSQRRAVFAVDRGPLYRLGETGFAGLGSTRPGWARRTAGLAQGEPLSPAELREARRRLWATGLFSAVSSDIDLAPEGSARVLFEVEEQPRFRVAYGLRWESGEGSSLVVDLLDRNFLGRNVDLGLRALRSDEEEQVRFSGTVPGLLGPKSRLELFARVGDEERLFEEGEILNQTRTFEGTVQLSWQLGRRSTGRTYARYRSVRFIETFLVEDPFFGPIDPISVRFSQPSMGLQFIFDGRDDRVAPRRGLFGSLDLSFSDETIGGDIRYARLFGQLHAFRPAGRLLGRPLTWAQSVRAGRAEAFGGQELLGDLLLRAGGEYSVRGYRRESLGPPALTGTILPSVETNSLLVLNQELRFGLWEPVSGLVFVDAGNVWIDDDVDFDLFTSLGLGLRADTPLGLLRLDLAFPLEPRDGVDPDVKLYFGLGNVF